MLDGLKKFFGIQSQPEQMMDKVKKEMAAQAAKKFFGIDSTTDAPVDISEDSTAEEEQEPKTTPKPRKATDEKRDPKKEFLKIFKKLTYANSPWNVWYDFVTLTSSALSNAVDKECYDEREERYLKTIGKYNKDEQALFPMLFAETVMALELDQDQDFLGDIFMTLDLENRAKGQFFTPYHICRLMASTVLGDIRKHVEENGYISINDPCCGAGATLIAGVNESRRQLEPTNLNFQNHVLIVAQDIDPMVAMMCYIQLSLLGVAGYVKVGNSLTEPITESDSTENYWFTPMYFSDVWVTRRLIKHLGKLIKDEVN